MKDDEWYVLEGVWFYDYEVADSGGTVRCGTCSYHMNHKKLWDANVSCFVELTSDATFIACTDIPTPERARTWCDAVRTKMQEIWRLIP